MNLAIEELASHDLIGHTECDWEWDPHNPSLAVVIAPTHQRKGFGLEACQLLLRYLFEYTPAHTVTCWIAEWNQPARQFGARSGFRESGRLRRAGIWGGQYYDIIVADLLRSVCLRWGGESHAA